MGVETGEEETLFLHHEVNSLRAQLADRSRECDLLTQNRQTLDDEVMNLSASLFEVCCFCL